MSISHQLDYESTVPASQQATFDWHSRPGAFQRLAPPWERLEIIDQRGTIGEGDGVTVRLRRGPFHATWQLQHQGTRPPEEFRDTQVSGPYRSWEHVHSFQDDPAGARMRDAVTYQIGGLSSLVGAKRTRKILERTFWYRHQRVARDLARHSSSQRLRVLIGGASGVIGTALAAFLTTGGHEVVRLVRRKPESPFEIEWNPPHEIPNPELLEGFDAVVSLSGENIGGGRWTRRRREAIVTSRVATTALLARTLAGLRYPPKVFYSQSAAGYYGSVAADPPPPLGEDAPLGEGFLAEVCRDWEAAADPAREAGIRVVHGRTGVVLDPGSSLLGRLLPLFRLGLGGVVAGGRQPLCWIGLDDVVGAIAFLIQHPSASGPYNLVGPEQVDNRAFTKELASLVRRPALAPVPGFALRLAMGEMGVELAVRGQSVSPQRLQDLGFAFQEPNLRGALAWELGLEREEVAAGR